MFHSAIYTVYIFHIQCDILALKQPYWWFPKVNWRRSSSEIISEQKPYKNTNDEAKSNPFPGAR